MAGCPNRRSPSRRRWSPTRWAAAFASFEEKQKGVITPGMLADLTMIDKDLREMPAPLINGARVMRTIVGGKTTFAR